MRLLLIEDDREIGAFVRSGLSEAGFTVDFAETGAEAIQMQSSEPYDLLIVDLMLPDMDGLEIVEEIRRKQLNTPVLILSAKRSVDDRVKGLQKGGDDYLTKPFVFSELLARVQALIRRSHGSTETTCLTFSELRLDLLKREVYRGGQLIDLQPREFALLEYLLRNRERVVSKTMILEHIWGYHFDPQTNVVDVLVSRLRSKLDRDYPVKYIHTIRGVGYVLKEPDKRE
ncbi:MAG TPA: response regulator transcription factor [Desulfosalsimonadaceae bacterium]|nr:response regulator transcription factor [Desulfosalsimonadaceae bacterium]